MNATPDVLALHRDGLLHAAAHVTGGGIAENLGRVLPTGLGATVRAGSPADFAALIARETERWNKVIRSSGFKIKRE